MSFLEAIFFGLIQGITEFLPISSSGHLAFMQILLGVQDIESLTAFNVLLHLGTLIAVFIVYFKDIIALVPAFFSLIGKLFKGKFSLSLLSFNERFVLLIIISTLPLIPAVLLEDSLAFISGYLSIIGAILVFNGFVLYFSDKISDRISRGKNDISTLSPLKAVLIGVFQAFAALLPGLSRSGSTITGGLLCGLDRKQAVKYSFIMSLPAIAGACILKLPQLFTEQTGTSQIAVYIAGAAISAIVGVLAMKLLNYISKKSNFRVFAYYCFAVGIALIAIDIFR